MAGSYPDAPGHRMAYDRDGSVVVSVDNTGVSSELDSAQKRALNNEFGSTTAGDGVSLPTGGHLAVIFPEVRDLAAYFLSSYGSYGDPSGVQVSTDTTNGTDGTWSAVALAFSVATAYPVKPAYRQRITSVSASGIKGIRVTKSAAGNPPSVYALHLYGAPSSSAGDRLELWHPTLDERLGASALDWGNVPRGSSADQTFRVKNVSTTLTASGITVSLEAPTDTTPSVPGQHLLSYSGGAFAATAAVGNLAPGAISGVVALRRVVAANAGLGVWAARVIADATTWA